MNPFNQENWQGTDAQIAKANAAYKIAAKTWFKCLSPECEWARQPLKLELCVRISDAFSDTIDAEEIAYAAITRDRIRFIEPGEMDFSNEL